MKNNVKKILCMSALAGFMLCSFGGVMYSQTASAAEETQTAVTDVLTKEGASIRYQADETTDYSGIRFSGYVSEDYLSKNPNATAGMLIIPATVLGNVELTEKVASVGFSPANEYVSGTDEYAIAGYKRFNTVLYNIPEADYNTQIVTRAYIENNGTYILADYTETRSIAQTASIGLAEGDTHTELNAYIDAVVTQFTVSESMSLAMNVSKAIDVSVEPSNLTVKYESKTPAVATVDKDGNVTGVSVGEATIQVSLGSTTKEVTVTVDDGEYEVTFNDAYARTLTATYGAKFNTLTSRPVSELYWDAECTDQVTEDDVITSKCQVYIKEEDKNTAELLSFDYACDVASSQVRFSSNAGVDAAEWLSEFEGEQGVMKVACNSWSTWAPQFILEDPKQSIESTSDIYTKYDYLVVKIYVVNDETYTGKWAYVGAETTSGPQQSFTDYNQWVTVKLDLSAVNTANAGNTSTSETALKILGKDGDSDASSKKALWYIADVSLEAISGTLTFTEENYADYLTAKGTADFAWSESANSMQITYTAGTYCGVTFKNLPWSYAWAKNKGYGYIAVEVYAVGDTTDMYDSTLTSTASLGHFRTNLGLKMVLCEEGGKKTDGNSDNKWVTVVLPLECLQQDTFQLYDQSGNTLARLYVRSMQLKEAKLTVSAVSSVDGGAFVFEKNFTVSATTSSGAAVDMSASTNYVYVLSTTGYGTGNIAGSAAGATSIASGRGETQYVWVTDTNTGEIGYTIITLTAAAA